MTNGSGKCDRHGGKSLRNEAHPNWKHGRCSKEARLRSKATTAKLRFIKALAIQLGMIQSW